MLSNTACFVLLQALPLAIALESPYATPTLKADDAAGLASGTVPKPTEGPAYRFGYQAKNALFARQETLTCGFFDHDPQRPNLCGIHSQCVFNQAQSYFGCCGVADSCDGLDPLSCLPYDGTGNFGGAEIFGSAVSCGSAVPDCQTTIFPTVNGLSSNTGPYTHFDCVASSTSVLYLYQDTTGAASDSSTTSPTPTRTTTRTRTTRSVVYLTSTETLSPPETTEGSDSSSMAETTSSETSSAAAGSGTASPTPGGAARAHQTAAAGIVAFALAAGGALL